MIRKPFDLFVVLIALVALMSVSATASAQTAAYDQALEGARALVLEKDYKSAIKAYKKAKSWPTFECSITRVRSSTASRAGNPEFRASWIRVSRGRSGRPRRPVSVDATRTVSSPWTAFFGDCWSVDPSELD